MQRSESEADFVAAAHISAFHPTKSVEKTACRKRLRQGAMEAPVITAGLDQRRHEQTQN
jgi:hypothetical protein